MDKTIIQRYEYWCSSDIFDEDVRVELSAIKDDEQEIEDRFYKELAFGTGGLRGIIGAGTNRMNKYTVGNATQGIANFINEQFAKQASDCIDSSVDEVVNAGTGEDLNEKVLLEIVEKAVAIAYDSRKMSAEFAEQTARCLNANGIKTYLFDSLRPTPELSFAVRELNCIAGVVITASHNPSEYNGYKVYWSDGAQITDKLAADITASIQEVGGFENIKGLTTEISGAGEATEAGNLYNIIGEEIDAKYIAELKKLIMSPDAIKAAADKLKIVYTPLHGAGLKPVKRILDELGFKHVYVVPEQELPDGDFPTVEYPNPEEPKVFELALKLAYKVDADLVLATDPDSDRLGVYVKDNKTKKYAAFSGNMTGILLAEYKLQRMQENSHLYPDTATLITTVVSSNMIDAVAEQYGINLIKTLTGFKYIGEQIKFFEHPERWNPNTINGDPFEFIFGFEESYGCLSGTHARDKDAVCAVMCLCDAASYYLSRGMTLCDQMRHLYKKYGFYRESILSITMPGMDGSTRIKAFMSKLRQSPLSDIAGIKVIEVRDYMTASVENKPFTYTDERTGKSIYEPPVEMPSSNVVYFCLENDAWVCIRPSGTEPKIKFYVGVKGESGKDATEKINLIRDYLKNVEI